MAKIKSYVADFTFNLIVTTVNGRLVTVKRTGLAKDTQFVSTCPVCAASDEVVRIKQQLVCTEHDDHGPFTQADVTKAKEVEGGALKAVSLDAVADAKVSVLPLNYLDLSVHSAADVDASTFPSDTAYVFYPKQVVPQYGLLLDALSAPDLAFIGACNLRNSEKLLRARRWGDNIVVESLFYTDDLNPRETVDVDYSADLGEMFRTLLAEQVKPFDAGSYVNTQREKVQALIAAGDGAVSAPTKPVKENPEDVLRVLLEQMLKEKS